MDSNNIATTAIAMMMGVVGSEEPIKLWNLWNKNGTFPRTGLELYKVIGAYADFTREVIDRMELELSQYSGSFDYEVSEHFGIWVRDFINRGGLPAEDVAKEKIGELIFGFFKDLTSVQTHWLRERTGFEEPTEHLPHVVILNLESGTPEVRGPFKDRQAAFHYVNVTLKEDTDALVLVQRAV